MTPVLRNTLGAVAVVALLGGAVLAQRGVDNARAQTGDELLYLPNEKLLTHFTAGMDSVVADLLWLQCVQYTGKQLRNEHSFTWLNHMLETTVRLDPWFTDVYRYGGMFLAALRADSDAGLELLRRGAVLRPDAWEIPYEMGMVHMLNRTDEPDALRKAAAYFAIATTRPDAPEYLREVADALGETYDIGELERQMWANMLDSDDRLLRDLAQEKLILVELREFTRQATEVALQFEAARGRPPRNLEELVAAGAMREVPQDPLGGAFIIGPNATVYSTSVLDDQAQRRKNILERHLEEYRDEHGGWPRSLEELVEKTPMTIVPPHPYPDRDWAYDPETGVVR